MSMRTASPTLTPCELLRQINDLCQNNDEKDNTIRRLCANAEKKAKRLTQELAKHDNITWHNWWEPNPIDCNILMIMRLRPCYLQEGSNGMVGKI